MRRKCLIVFISLMGLVIFATASGWSEQIQYPDWYIYSSEYIKFDKKIFKPDVEEMLNESNFDYLCDRTEAKRKFARSSPPSKEDIETLLTSSNIEEVYIGAVAIFLSGEFKDAFVDKLMKIFTSGNDFFAVRYASMALNEASPEAVSKYESDIISYFRQANNFESIIQAQRLLLKLPTEKVSIILTDMLKSDTRSIRRLAYTLLSKLGNRYLEDALEHIIKAKNIDKETFIEDLKKRDL